MRVYNRPISSARYCLLLVTTIFVFGIARADDVKLFSVTPDGRKPIQDSIDKVRLFSLSNDNQTHQLELIRAKPFTIEGTQIVLAAGGKECSCGYEGVEGSVTSILVAIYDEAVLQAVKDHFHVTAEDRKHPGYRMLVTFEPDKKTFSTSEAITVKLRIKNVGDTTFCFIQGGLNAGPRDNQFAFSAQHLGSPAAMLPDIGNPFTEGGMGNYVTLKPLEEAEIPVEMSNWFHFNAPGKYSIRGSYYMRFVDPVKRGIDTIWEDFACAEFQVSIQK